MLITNICKTLRPILLRIIKLNILIYGMSFSVIIYVNCKCIDMVKFFGNTVHTCISLKTCALSVTNTWPTELQDVLKASN